MPVIRFNNTANTMASSIVRRAQGRAVFADALTRQKNLDLNCLNRVAAGPAATTSYDGSKYIDQRIGTVFTTSEQAAEIIAKSPCEQPSILIPIEYPNYSLTCSDPLGIQIMATGTFTKFTFTTTSQGAGVIEFQFFFQDAYVSNQLVVLGVDSNLITPPPITDEVRYVFKCNPVIVLVYCEAFSNVLQWTIPYKFVAPDILDEPLTLTLYQHPSGSTITHVLSAGDQYTPSPAWGYDSWAVTPCP